ncbi:MAG: flagellar basal body rod protein FlgC [Candidatus Hydrogenedens sp.]|nr:flagellar basal body rod protein FlgC [Candidatus Hydrogenedens sp.]
MLLPAANVSARQIAVSGLRAQRTRLNLIANNIANAETTRTPEGGAFRRQVALMRGNEMKPGYNPEKLGVRVSQVVRDTSPFRTIYDPSHPDANADGYVQYPNVDIAVEMANMVSAQRAYEANIAVLATGSRMGDAAMDLLVR